MATFRYRAATAAGEMRSGTLEGASVADVVARLRRSGLLPIETSPSAAVADRGVAGRTSAATRQGAINAIGELGVLVGSGLTLDRALTVCIEAMSRPDVQRPFQAMHKRVSEGAPLSAALAQAGELFPPMASAMIQAGEADGRLDVALARLAETLEQAEALRQTIISAMIYPALLLVIACSVILMMLLFVVPQFESLFSEGAAKLPFMTRLVMGASHGLRAYGLFALGALAAGGFLVRQWLKQPSMRATLDAAILKAPMIGPLVVNVQTARFARVLGALVEGGVALPTALSIAQRSLSNAHMAAGVGRVAAGLKEGAGLSRPLAATGLFPPMALSFLRTGEETAQLGMMLNRLANVLDRDVKTTLQRLIAILTPAITVVMGGVVATVIASIMSAILGFNDLALSP